MTDRLDADTLAPLPAADQTGHDHAAHDHGDACGCAHDHDHGHQHQASIATFRRAAPKVGRNDPCPCGSGKKHKKCCLAG